jgi:hypothetical protein
MGLDQLPVDLLGEKRIDMLVTNGFARAVEDDVIPVTHARHQLDAEEPGQTEDRFALALSIGVERVRLDCGAVPYQPVQDMDGLPDIARDEASEQRNVAVGDVVIGDTAIPAIADVLGADEIVFTQWNMGAIANRNDVLISGLCFCPDPPAARCLKLREPSGDNSRVYVPGLVASISEAAFVGSYS